MSASLRHRWTHPKRLIPLALLLLIALAILGLKLSSRSSLERELAAIRAQGLPTNPIELDRWYAQVPASSNAALKIIEANRYYVEPVEKRDPGMVEWSDIPHDQPLSAEIRQVTEQHLANNEHVLSLLHEAASLPFSRYPTEIHKGPDFNMAHLVQVKRSVQMFRWAAIIAAERGHADSPFQALISSFAVSHTLAREPLLISELVRIACLSIHLAGMERVTSRADFDDAQLAALARATESAANESRGALHRALIGERAYANNNIEISYDQYANVAGHFGGQTFGEHLPSFVRRAWYNSRVFFGAPQRDLTFYIHNLGKIIAATDPASDSFINDVGALAVSISDQLDARGYIYMQSKISLPNMLYAPPKEALLIARLRCAELALQIERFRLRHHGRLPRADELVPAILPELPRDPFDNSPLQYELLPKGYRILAPAATAHERRTRTNAPPVAFTVLR